MYGAGELKNAPEGLKTSLLQGYVKYEFELFNQSSK